MLYLFSPQGDLELPQYWQMLEEPKGLRGGDRDDRPAMNTSTPYLCGPHVSTSELFLEDIAVTGTSSEGRSSITKVFQSTHTYSN